MHHAQNLHLTVLVQTYQDTTFLCTSNHFPNNHCFSIGWSQVKALDPLKWKKKTGTKISWCIMTHRLVQCLATVLVKNLLLSFSYYYHHHLIFIHRGSAVLRLISFWPTELRAKVKWRWTQLGFKERIHIWNQLWAAGPLWLKIGIFSKLIWF